MFKVGDEVVCVDAMGVSHFISAGKVYRVSYIGEVCVSVDGVLDFGYCQPCRGQMTSAHFYKWRFVKLPREKVEGTEAMPIEVGVE